MKATNYFTRTILTYLEQRATTDALFAEAFAKVDKNIDDCITYILNAVQKSGCNGFADDEVYSMAVHYYDEDNIEVDKAINCKMVVNHVVELTKEEKEQAHKDAIQQALNESYAKMKQPKALSINKYQIYSYLCLHNEETRIRTIIPFASGFTFVERTSAASLSRHRGTGFRMGRSKYHFSS